MTQKANQPQLTNRALQLYGRQLIKDNDFPEFCKVFLPEPSQPYFWQEFYNDIWEAIQHSTEIGILAPRGHGKSSTFMIAYSVFEALRNPDIKIAVASNTESTVDDMLRPIIAFFQSPKIKAVFGDVVDKTIDNSLFLKTANKSVIKPEPTISVYSAKSGKITGKHFDLVIVDDIVTLHNSQTPHGRELTYNFYANVLIPTIREGGQLLINGTRYHPLDLYGKLIKQGFKFKVFKAISNEGKALSPSIMSLDSLNAILRKIGKIAFNCQYQNDASLIAEGNLIKPESMQYYQDRFKDREGFILPIGQDYRYIQAIDLGVGGEGDDYSVSVMIAFNTKTKLIYVVDLVAHREKVSLFKKRIKNQWEKYRQHYPVVYCEANNFQTSIVQDMNDLFRDMRIQPVKNTANKYSRFIGALTPVFDDMRIYFNQYNPQNTLIEEQLFALTATGSDTNDDIPDAITMAIEKLPKTVTGKEIILL